MGQKQREKIIRRKNIRLNDIGCDGISFGQRLLFFLQIDESFSGKKNTNKQVFWFCFASLLGNLRGKKEKSHSKSNCLPAKSLLFAVPCA